MRIGRARGAEREGGFTLIELLMTLSLLAILLTLAVFALRQFWFVRSLEGGTDEIVTQLRNLQQNAVSESNPVVYGAAFREDTSKWVLVRYLPPSAGSPGCTVAGTRTLDAGVEVDSATFAGSVAGLNLADARTTCAAAVQGQIGSVAGDDLVFFLARGTALAGSVTVTQPRLGRSHTVTVTGLTSRVART